jgi:hypothetical protein
MSSGVVASLVATLALGFVEGLGRFYPARATWWRLRRARGRRAVRAMRERFEAAAGRRGSRRLALVLLVLVIAWIASASLLDKRWYEVVLDVTPYMIVVAALLRIPHTMSAIAQRMRDHERQAGEDPDADQPEEEGPSELTM